MTKPNDFILNSDYATLKNDANGNVTVTLPASFSISGGGIAIYRNTIALGSRGSSFRAYIYSPSTTYNFVGEYYVNTLLNAGIVSGSTVDVDIFVYVYRSSPTEVGLTVKIPNAYGSTMTLPSMGQSFTSHIATFLPPVP